MSRIVEIGGGHVEVEDVQSLPTYKIGDRVKVLVKEYGDRYREDVGMIVAFTNFSKLPSITVAHLKRQFGSAELQFTTLNQATTDVEIAPATAVDLLLEKSDILDYFDREILKKQTELKEIETKKSQVLKQFDKWFEQPLKVWHGATTLAAGVGAELD